MDCQVCSEEIPGDSLFCPECGARQDPSKSGAMGGRNFGVVSPQAVQATHDMQAADATGGSSTDAASAGFLNQIADQMTGVPPTPSQEGDPSSITDQVVDQIVESERAEKAGARNEWLAMNQKRPAVFWPDLLVAKSPNTCPRLQAMLGSLTMARMSI